MKAIVATHFLRSNIRQIVNFITSESKSSPDDNPGVFGRGSYKVALAVLNLLCIPGWGGGGQRAACCLSLPSATTPILKLFSDQRCLSTSVKFLIFKQYILTK